MVAGEHCKTDEIGKVRVTTPDGRKISIEKDTQTKYI